MNRTMFTFAQEPRGALYRRLVEKAPAFASRGLVVVRRDDQLAESARAVLRALAPFGVEERITDKWPGTVLYGSTARVKEFQLTDRVLEVLLSAAEGLFDWLHPALPEDLCFLRADASPWMASISHERDAFLELSPAELDELKRAAPDIVTEIEQDQSKD